jgi:hypothetical protein
VLIQNRIKPIFFFGHQVVAGVRGTQNIAVSASASIIPFATKVVGWWLLGCGGMVFGAVVLGNLQVC